MGTFFHDAPLVQHYDAIGVAHRAQTVGDDEHGAALADVRHVALNDGLAFVVESAGGFVQNQDARVGKQGACDGDALALASAQGASLFAHDGVVALGQFAHEVVRTGQLGRPDDRLYGRARIGYGNVLAHAAVEQQVLLQHHADLSAQLRRVYQADVDAVHQQPAALGRVQALD